MKIISYLIEQNQIELNQNEVLLSHQDLSRFGKLSTEELEDAYKKCLQMNLTPVLEWDILMTENIFLNCQELVRELKRKLNFKIIRVQDPGALQFVLDEFGVEIQLNLETGNHNIESVLGWCEYAPSQIKRIILSSEIQKKDLKIIIFKLRENFPQMEVEVLGYGRILLFYSPRFLLSPLTDERSVRASSEENSHRDFLIEENKHGTFMIHPRPFSLLEKINDLEDCGVTHLRVDKRWDKIENYSPFQGFFGVNKTDVLFSKLKNKNLTRVKDNEQFYLGELIDVSTGKFAALRLQKLALSKNNKILIKNPNGKEFYVDVNEMWDTKWNLLDEARNKIIILKYHKGMSVASLVYLFSEEMKN